jgi:hypothetical protein
VTDRGFSLDDRDLSADLIIRADGIGLHEVSSLRFSRGHHSIPLLLAVQSASASRRGGFAVGSSGTLSECRVRGRLVDVQLDSTDRCPARMHVYWKAGARGEFDLEVLASSVHVLDNFEVQTVSRFPSGDILVRASGTGSGWINVRDGLAWGCKWFVFSRDRTAGIRSLDGRPPADDLDTLAGFYRQPIILYRPAGERWSYIVMSRPDDCVHMVVGIERRSVTVSFGLFGLDIEKGVILRGRVRGMFIPRANDLRMSLRHFARFVAESLRLSV